MNTEILSIGSMFAGTTSTVTASSKSDAKSKTSQFSPISDDKPPQANTLEKTTTESPYKAQDSAISKERSATSNTAEQPDMVQNWLAEHSVPVEQSKEGAATRIEAKAGRQPAQLSANSRTEKSPPITGQAAKSAEIKLLLTTGKGQLGLKTVLPETAKGQIGLKTVLPNTSNRTSTTNIQPGIGKNDKIPISNKTIVDTKALTNRGTGKELTAVSLNKTTAAVVNILKTSVSDTKKLTPEAIVNDGGKIAIAVKKQTTTDASAITDTPKRTVSSKEKLFPEKPIDGSSKTNPASEKTSAVNTSFPAIQAKSAELKSWSKQVGPEKSALTAEKTANNKATAPQILSESSVGNGKKPLHAGDNLSNAPTVQKLNVTEFQTSTGQTKSDGNPTSQNRANLDIEQILPQNNAQAPIAENAKTANLPEQNSRSNVSADISKQILESIHSSLTQQGGDRQIIVRLYPPELGKVFIKFQEQDTQIIGLLEVSKIQTKFEIEQALPQIIRNLTDCGIQIRRLDVIISNPEQSQQEALKDPSFQNGGAQQQDSANPGTQGNDTNTNGINDWLINNNNYQNISELQEAFITGGSINILI